MKMNVTLEQWMALEWMPQVEGSGRYRIGHQKTKEQAKDIMRIVARSTDFEVGLPSTRKLLKVIGSPYRDFIV